jgi:SPP1 gp7 family putative phage head morphogenesis protein
MGKKQFAIATRYDRALAKEEDATISRVNTRLEQAFSSINGDLTTYYENLQDEGSLTAQMRVRRSEELKTVLTRIDPSRGAQYEREFEQLITTATQTGRTLGDELLTSYQSDLVGQFTNIPYQAIAAQARDGAIRLSKHTEAFQDKASAVIEMGLVQGKSSKWMQRELRNQLGVTKSKAETIARTESTAAFNTAAQSRYKAGGVDFVQWMITPSNRVCPFCAARNGNVYRNGAVAVPIHPRDRCILLPWSPDWQRLGLTDDEFVKDYREKGLKDLRSLGLQPDYGLAPFERANKVKNVPVAIWKPGDAVLNPIKKIVAPRPTPPPQPAPSPDLPNEDYAIKNFTLIGEGVEGRVYSDGKLAYKYTNVITGDQAEFVEKQRREALLNVKAVGDLGVGPKVHKISKDASSFSMDLLKGYEEGISPFAIGSKEDRAFSSQFINHLKTLEKDGRAPLDIKEDNVMFNRKTKDLLFVDQGHTKKTTAAERAKLYFDRAGSRPLAHDTISSYIKSYGSKADIKAYTKLQKKFNDEVLLPDPFRRTPKPKTEADHKKFIDSLFKIVDNVGLPQKAKATAAKAVTTKATAATTKSAVKATNVAPNIPRKPERAVDFVKLGRSRHDDILTEIDKVNKTDQKARERYNAAFERLKTDFSDKAQIAFKEAATALDEKSKSAFKEATTLHKQLRDRLINAGNKSSSDRWAETVLIKDSAALRRPAAELRRELSEFDSLTGGKARTSLSRLEYTRDRAFANKTGVINIGNATGSKGKSDLFHEAGHHVEFSEKRFFKAADEFLYARAKTRELVPIYPGVPERANEIRYPGKFVDDYVSRVYIDKKTGKREEATEVISVGLEHFAKPETMAHLYHRDPDMFELILGIIESD